MVASLSFARVVELYDLADVTADIAKSDRYSDEAAEEIELLAKRQPSNQWEAIENFRLAAMLAHDDRSADLIDYAFNLTEKRGRTLEAIIAMREARGMVPPHSDFSCLAVVLKGLIVYLSQPTRVA